MDVRSWRNRIIATMPDNQPSRPWPLLGMLTLGLVAGVAIGGYAVSQRSRINQLAMHAHRMRDEIAAMGRGDAVKPMAVVTASRSNHRRKAASEV
jgi:hypothetical protein